jgi:23S rRNA pseudouridine1911/1915/1917 synthase
MKNEKMLELSAAIIYEDDYLLAINKPAGVVVNRAETVQQETLQDFMEERYSELFITDRVGESEEIFYQRSGLVHRLDKDTSGVILLAKQPEILIELMRQFKHRETAKEYLALVHGMFEPVEGNIRLPIKRSMYNRHRFAVDVDGRESETFYQVKSHWRFEKTQELAKSYQDGFSLMRLFPKTGRTHQLRVHLSFLKHPIISDEVYGGKRRVGFDRQWCPRQFLHAHALTFFHPHQQEPMTIKAPLAQDLQLAMRLLKET